MGCISLARASSQYAYRPYASGLVGLDLVSTGQTFMFWMKPGSNLGTSPCAILSKGSQAGLNKEYCITYQGSSGAFLFRQSPDGDATEWWAVWDPGPPQPVGTWVHITVTTQYVPNPPFGWRWDINWYKNGQWTKFNGTGADVFNSFDGDFYVGRGWVNDVDGYSFDGQIDEVQVHNYRMSDAEIALLYNQTLPGTEPTFGGYWRFEGDLLDKTSHDNDLTMVNGGLLVSGSPPLNPGALILGDVYRGAGGEVSAQNDVWPNPEPPSVEDVGLEGVELLAHDTLRVVFDRLMVNDTALKDPSSYQIVSSTGATLIMKDSLTGTDEATDSIVLVFTPTVPGETYTLSASGLTGSDGHVWDPTSTLEFQARRTKMDSVVSRIEGPYTREHRSVLRLVLQSLAREDDRIGGSRDDFLG
jgi:hypothetical protein